MDSPLLVYTFAAGLLALGGYYGWRQVRTLRAPAAQENVPPDDRRYMRGQAWLRLVSCSLLVVLAGLLAGAYLLGLENRTNELIAQRQAANAEARRPPATAEQRQQINRYTTYWLVTILVLLAIMCLAAIDLWNIRKFGLRNLRKIKADRRAMIERQVAIFRSQRNGHE